MTSNDPSYRFAPPAKPLLQLAVPPDGLVTSKIREFVGQFCQKIFMSQELIFSLELATHELLENAIKYSTPGANWPSLEIFVRDSHLAIEASNRADPPHREALATFFEELRSNPDPHGHYQVLMQRAAGRTVGSGLGLGRIRAEAGMELELRIEGDLVTVRATRRIESIQ